MEVKTLIEIRSNYYIARYLRENSYWYKYLNRNPESIFDLEKEMKEHYKLTTKDKMESFTNKLAMIQNFMEILR